MIDQALLHNINKIVSENAALKKELHKQKEIARNIELHDISKDVAYHIDNWMNVPYLHGKTRQQDINEFAFKLTKYIDQKLRN